MKFTAEQRELAKSASFVSVAITSKTTLAIQNGIMLSVSEDGILTMTGSDKELGIEKRIKVTGDYEPGSVVLPSKYFLDIIKKMPDGAVTTECSSVENVRIFNDSASFALVGNPAEDYPDIGNVNEKIKIKINREAFVSMAKKTAFAASRDESRGTVIGVLIETNGDELSMVALDGFRMAIAKEKAESTEDTSIIITAKIISDLATLLTHSEFTPENSSGSAKGEGDADDTIEMITDNKRAVIKSENSKIIISLIKGDFIDYKRIIPDKFDTCSAVGNDEFTDSVSRVSIMAEDGRNNLIKLSVKGNSIIVASNSENGKAEESLPASTDGEDIEIGFNAKYLSDGLKVFSVDELMLNFISPIKPCIIKEREQENYMYMILPVRLLN